MELKYIRIRTYLNCKFTGCEHIYLTTSQSEALERFRREYPEHNACIAIAADYDPKENPSHFEACKRCGCVHFW